MNFEEQAQQKAAGDDEAQVTDEEFLGGDGARPTTNRWLGHGNRQVRATIRRIDLFDRARLTIYRLVMFLTDNYSIKEGESAY